MADEADDDQPVSAPFSAHARGVPLSVSENFEFGSNIESGLLQLLDITGAGIHLILANGWLTVIQIVITIACTSFYSYLGVFSVQADLDFSILSFAVLLPLVLAVFRSIQRRDTALKELAAVKTLIIHYKLLSDGALDPASLPASHESQLEGLLSNLIDAMRDYFMPARFYSRHHLLLEVKYKMMKIAQGRSRQMLRVMGTFNQLAGLQQGLKEAGMADVHGVLMSKLLLKLQATFEHMATIKEFRTPQGIRSLLLVYVTLVVPIFFGPYYSYVRNDVNSFAFALFLVIVLNFAITSLLHISIALEDPFDPQVLDGVFVDEALLEAKLAGAAVEELSFGTSALGALEPWNLITTHVRAQAIQMDRRQAAAFAADTGGIEDGLQTFNLRGRPRSMGLGAGGPSLPPPTDNKEGTLPL